MTTHPGLGSSPSSLNLLNTIETNGTGTISSDTNDPPTYQSVPINPSIPPQNNSIQNNQPIQNHTETSIWKQSSHPVALFFLYFFRSLAITTYVLCGFFSDSYVFSTVIVVILLSADFWTVRNVSGRVLVGLRFWNQVDEDGSSYWVFESRDPSQPSNAVDLKMFWTALYAFPTAWVVLFFIGLLKFNLSFLPIVLLALVFNFTNTIGFTYADRDSKRKLGSSASNLLNNFGGGLVSSLAKVSMGKLFK
ncbi:uncharacterized protein MELLADRAFT_70753 [Melampsora larici-populina 98AG31]|uniref:Golgi apparatus membrane protein TVP23 n=1 Tax=Melampsora larici-populina (strain 98AG31 / pathotype 3-4-7) TaxID=747676 RepID=F4R7M2_MELLP|nr:uncharacterized protein MELLADRAFT_70753 [Melampsora larici-populina 98AG31]EGG11760.1 hypothetical protein MELLADRAFT_70753 [Melampsora larici-populina 98AG31]